MQAGDGPFSMSFGRLKRLLIDEEVVAADCRDTEIREHIEAQLHDESVKSKPLKYQMAWLVQELDLQTGFGDVSEYPNPRLEQSSAGPPPRSRSGPSKRSSSTSRNPTVSNPLNRAGSFSTSSQSSASSDGPASRAPRTTSRSVSRPPTRSSSSKRPTPTPSSPSSANRSRNPPTTRNLRQVAAPTRGADNNRGRQLQPSSAGSSSSSSSGYGYGKASLSPRVLKVPNSSSSSSGGGGGGGGSERNKRGGGSGSQARTTGRGGPGWGAGLQPQPKAVAAGGGTAAAAAAAAAAGRGGGGRPVSKSTFPLRRSSSVSTASTQKSSSSRSGATDAEASSLASQQSNSAEASGARNATALSDDENDVATVARTVAGGVLLGSYQVLDVGGLSPQESAPLVWHRMGEVLRKEGLARAAELFQRFDEGGSGLIGGKEFRQALVLMSVTGHTDAVAKAVLDLGDAKHLNLSGGGKGVGRGGDGKGEGDGFDGLDYGEVVEALRGAQVASAVAWRRVLAFLRESPEGATAVESMFSSMDGNDNRALDKSELASGMLSIGVDLSAQQLEAFKDDLDANKDGCVSLEEFSAAVESRSVDTASSEREGWSCVLGSLLIDDQPHHEGGNDDEQGGRGSSSPPAAENNGNGNGGGGGGSVDSGRTSEAKMRAIQQAFDESDENGDGVLDLSELVGLLLRLGVRMSDVQAELLREAMDTNGDGMISRDEFVRVLETQRSLASNMVWFGFLHFLREHADTAAMIEDLFASCDADGDESLDVDELSAAVQAMGMQLDPLQLHLFHADLDLNGNGDVSLDEFTSAIEIHGAAMLRGGGEFLGGGGGGGLVQEEVAAAEVDDTSLPTAVPPGEEGREEGVEHGGQGGGGDDEDGGGEYEGGEEAGGGETEEGGGDKDKDNGEETF